MNEIVIVNVISKWHVYGAESVLQTLEMNEKTQVIVFIQYHTPSGRYRVSKNDFVFLNSKSVQAEYMFVKEASEQLRFLKTFLEKQKNKDTHLTMLSPNQMNMWQVMGSLGIPNRDYVILDEGMGTYYSKVLWGLETNALIGNKNTKSVKSMLLECIRKVILNVFCRTTTDNRILKYADEKWTPDAAVLQNYRDYFVNWKDKKIDVPVDDGDVVFVSDNLKYMLKDSRYEEILYKKIYQILCERFCHAKIYFKPHPNEINDHKLSMLSEIGFVIFEQDYSYEEIVNAYNVNSCGFGSTSLMTAALIFNRNAYSLFSIIPEDYLNEYGRQKREENKNIVENIRNLTSIIEE